MPLRLDSVLSLVAIALVVLALPRCRPGPPALSPMRASPQLTPGALNPAVTPATLSTTICRHGWTRTIRPPVAYTNDLKQKQMRAYRRRGPPSGYQEDHLISLELGGDPTDPRNLWPEPYPRASTVDGIENDLNAQVCSGKLSLDAAQRREAELKHTAG
jgi:hypothetical protein